MLDLPLLRIPLHRRVAPADRLRESLLELAQHKATILTHSEKSWASLTFSGARHRLALLFDGAEAIEAAERFIAFLPEHEFDILGHLVADATVTEVDHRLDPPAMTVRCELLLLEER
ncbi:MAG TPA: hypothetical protein VI168_00645 [Croceibacterium sp.]